MVRLARLLTILFVLAPIAIAQEHYLVTPQEEVVPLRPGDAAGDIVRRVRESRAAQNPTGCSPILPFYQANPWPVTGNWRFYHLDALGQWYVVPATGTIDTIFFNTQSIGRYYHDSLVFVRVHRSHIGPSYGPGVRPGPFAPPCQPWGYWINTNDLDQGVSAFPEAATDTTWVSSVRMSSVPSSPPIGEELWGAGGFNFYMRPNSVNAVAMADLAPLDVEAGDLIFISIQLNWQGPDDVWYELEEPAEFLFSETTVSTSDEYYPSRNWKFYEHMTATSCYWTLDSVKPGWYARGSTSGDSTDAVLWDVWYSMTVTGNAPPVVVDQTSLMNTFSTAPRTFDATIEDCYSVNPALSGVASASIRYEVGGTEQAPIPMAYLGGDVWEGVIPGQPPGSMVTGRIEATDLEGMKSNGPSFAYTVVPFGNSWYAIDTGYACTPRDIRLTGTTIDAASFFLPPTAPPGASAQDDGTSGPYDLGDNFLLFDDAFRYAWIGVSGGLALSKSPADTHDVNSNGMFLAPGETRWDFPHPQNHGRGSPGGSELMPPMFIAPFWADHILADDSGSYGRIVIGNAGDTCLFVAEWDSIGTVTESGPAPSATTFRAVLNRCTGAVEFQYGPGGDWSAYPQSLTGMQADSGYFSGPEPGSILLSRDGAPSELAPADGRCVRLFPTVGMVVGDGWNLAAISLRPLDGDYSVGHLFPGYHGIWRFIFPFGYVSMDDTLAPGRGFWIKSSGAGRIGSVAGEFIHEMEIPVTDKWNLVGGPSGFLPNGSIFATGGTIISPFYGYGPSGYYTASFVQPGHAYWVKMMGSGTLSMSSWGMPAISDPGGTRTGSGFRPPSEAPILPDDAGRITIRDASGRSQTLYVSNGTDDRGNRVDPTSFELPPLPPDGLFDVRFASGRMLEVVGGTRSVDGASTPPSAGFNIAVRGARYPLTVEWDFSGAAGALAGLSLAAAGTDPAASIPMAAGGSATFDALPSGILTLRLDGATAHPSAFALGPNYPNPFNPSTSFNVDIPAPSEVRVEVIDLLGRSVAELMTGPQPAGSHRLSWNGVDRNGVAVPSGVYVLRFTAPNYSASRKALLVR